MTNIKVQTPPPSPTCFNANFAMYFFQLEIPFQWDMFLLIKTAVLLIFLNSLTAQTPLPLSQ